MTQKHPRINYQVAMSDPTSHLFEITLEISSWQSQLLNLKFPIWTPGSYLIREYSKNLQNFQAKTTKNKDLSVSQIAKNYWQVQTNGLSTILISYKIYANELSVRTNHLDSTHGYFNGAALFFWIPGLEKEPIELKIIPPYRDWLVSTTLPEIKNKSNTFLAEDFDTLVDSPFEIGKHTLYNFHVLNKPHQLAIWGKGNFKPEKLLEDISKIVETEAKMFGGLPYEKYIFLLHLSSNGYGGLEHKNSCSLLYNRFSFGTVEKYQNFMQLVAHEFFHLWNVKRIRPIGLETFDYDAENYTDLLWFSEGATSYYDVLIPQRAGIYSSQVLLEKLSKDITRYLNTNGRKVQSASQSSFDAWIKLYRRDANSDNSQISYYLKGEMLCLVLDLIIRRKHQNQKSFDNVLVELWEKFGQDEIGFNQKQLREIVESYAEQDLGQFFQDYVEGVEEIPFNDYLEPFGIILKPEINSIPYLGVKAQKEAYREIIKFVEMGSPAQIAGLAPEDELLAIDDFKVSAEQLTERLKDYQANDIIKITVFHQDELKNLDVQLGQPRASRYELVKIQTTTEYQKTNLQGWLE